MDYIYMLKKLWKYAECDRKKIVLYYIFHIISVFGIIIQPYAFSMVINTLQENSTNLINDVLFWLTIYMVGFAVFNLFHRIARFIERDVAFNVKKRFIVKSYGILQALPLQWHNENHSGSVIDRLNTAGDSLYHFGNIQANCIEAIMKFVGSAIMLTMISPIISIVAITFGVIMILITKKMYTVVVPEYRLQNEKFHDVSAALFDYIRNINTIIILKLGKLVQKDLSIRLDGIFPHIQRENKVTQLKCFYNELLTAVLNVGLIFYYIKIRTVMGTAILIGTITAIFQYLEQLISSFQFYAFHYEDIIHWSTNFKAASPIYVAYEENEKAKKGRLSHIKGKKWDESNDLPWDKIEIGPLNYAYENSNAGLFNVKVKINKGKRIAFIGESGAGKSTFLHIMKGVLPINEIDINIDGKYADINMLEKFTTFIPQEAEIFENSIRYNITMGLPDDESEIEKSLRLAGFDNVVKKLPNGIDTDIRENGVNLSGGEKQRLALARGLYSVRNSSILLLDEPTNNLDIATERMIYNRIFEGFSQKAIVSVLHRLHLLCLFDYVYVFKNGSIIEHGTYQELMENRESEFIQLWNEYLMNSKE